MKGGIGSHSIKLPNGLVVSALVGVNALVMYMKWKSDSRGYG